MIQGGGGNGPSVEGPRPGTGRADRASDGGIASEGDWSRVPTARAAGAGSLAPRAAVERQLVKRDVVLACYCRGVDRWSASCSHA